MVQSIVEEAPWWRTSMSTQPRMCACDERWHREAHLAAYEAMALVEAAAEEESEASVQAVAVQAVVVQPAAAGEDVDAARLAVH